MPKVRKQTPAKKRKKKTKSDSVIDRITPISSKLPPMNINVYGRSGTGKTTFACEFPKPLLLIGAEDGTESVYDVKGVDFVRIYESLELGQLIDLLQEGKYKTAVLDTATSLQDIVLKEILGIGELPAQLGWGVASQQQWSQCALQMKELLRSFLSVPIHSVVTAQEREFNTEGDTELLMPYVAAAVSPSVAGWLNPACNYICQTFIRREIKELTKKVGKKVKKIKVKGKEVEYCLRVGPNPVYTTKFRTPKSRKIQDVIVDPTFAKIQKLLGRE